IEPLESTSIHLIQTAVNRLLELLPGGEIGDVQRDEYNRRTDFEIERIRDFIILHYHANQRHGEAMWDEVRNMQIPQELHQKIELFRASGAIFRDGEELFDIPGWIQVLIGQNVIPQHWHPIADQVADVGLRKFIESLEKAYVQDAARMTDHGQYLSRFAPMEQPKPQAARVTA
ncbi:MAG TPA: tryptophan 7-halogenase, partial [Sphingomicrobium sp.]